MKKLIKPIDSKRLKIELLEQVENKLRNNSNYNIIRIEIKIPNIEPLNWLNNQTNNTKIFFSGKDIEDFTIAALGIADIIQSSKHNDPLIFNNIKTRLLNCQAKYYGGISFPEKEIGEEWHSFGVLKFVLPIFEIIKKDEQTFFACNIINKDGQDNILLKLENEFNNLNFKDKEIQCSIEKPNKIINLPEYPNWEKTVRSIVKAIKLKRFNKIVLARKIIYQFDNKINPIALMYRLKKNLFNRYNFLFQFEEGISFIGSSMERLYKRTKQEIKSEGIAGSIKRGHDIISDKKLINKLKTSKKDNLEQDFVVCFIQKQLSTLCKSLNQSNKTILKLKEISHLKTEFKGSLNDEVKEIDIINSLHPTPAVGGDPWNIVSKNISKFEPFNRGWYAGIIGYIGNETADFSVALRSGLIYNNSLSLYVGVGIVEGSKSDTEWEEGNWKIKNYEDIFENNLNEY